MSTKQPTSPSPSTDASPATGATVTKQTSTAGEASPTPAAPKTTARAAERVATEPPPATDGVDPFQWGRRVWPD